MGTKKLELESLLFGGLSANRGARGECDGREQRPSTFYLAGEFE